MEGPDAQEIRYYPRRSGLSSRTPRGKEKKKLAPRDPGRPSGLYSPLEKTLHTHAREIEGRSSATRKRGGRGEKIFEYGKPAALIGPGKEGG